MLELLVPAGSPEAVTAAVQKGADAVYLSFDELTDCRHNVNFTDEAFEAAIRYCRIRSCKVYLSLNTPVRDDELGKAAQYALRAQHAGADAIIVRDPGLAKVLQGVVPEMPLFADFRFGFYTPQSIEFAKGLGFQRIFLPPELPLDEVKRLSGCGLETAVFVQTTLCPAIAGTCRMSTLCGHGSADRGLCSEPCREAYSFGGRWDGYPLSWKDRCLLSCVRELEEAGVACACIGNRENRPEYSAAMAEAFSTAIRENQQPSVADWDVITKAFSKYGHAGDDVFETPQNHERLTGRALEKYCAQIRQEYSENEQRRVPVRFAVVARSEQENIHLGVQDEEGHSAVLEGPLPIEQGDVLISQDGLSESMYRTSGTPFRCTDVQVVAAENIKVSGIDLDAARRKLLYDLSEERAKIDERDEGVFPEPPMAKDPSILPCVNFSVQSADQLTTELADLQPLCVYVPIEVLIERPDAIEPFSKAETEIVASLPAVVGSPEEEEQLRRMMNRLEKIGVHSVLTGNAGLALIAKQEGMTVRGDIDLAVYNAYSLQILSAAGFASAALSPELSLQQIAAMPKPIFSELVIYGRIPAMTTSTCLLKASAGRCTCTIPGQMTDTHGGVWPVTKAFGCRNTVWSSRKIWMGDVINDWVNCGLWAVRLNFSTESPRECLEVARSYMLGTGYRPNGITRGLYYRGVL